jgi:hypothetical protein
LAALSQKVGRNIEEKTARTKNNAVSEYAKPIMTLVTPSINGSKANITAVLVENPRYRIEKNITNANTIDLKILKIIFSMIPSINYE